MFCFNPGLPHVTAIYISGPFHHGTIVSPAPGGDSSVVVVKYPLNPHHKALCLFGQHSIIHMSEAHLLLVVVDLNLHELLLKGVHPILILVLKVGLEARDTEVTLKKIRKEKLQHTWPKSAILNTTHCT